MATAAIKSGSRQSEINDQLLCQNPLCVRACFDGGRRESLASYGWVLYGAFEYDNVGKPVWRRVCAGADILGDASAIHAELCGASVAIRRAIAFASGNLVAEEILHSDRD